MSYTYFHITCAIYTQKEHIISKQNMSTILTYHRTLSTQQTKETKKTTTTVTMCIDATA